MDDTDGERPSCTQRLDLRGLLDEEDVIVNMPGWSLPRRWDDVKTTAEWLVLEDSPIAQVLHLAQIKVFCGQNTSSLR